MVNSEGTKNVLADMVAKLYEIFIRHEMEGQIQLIHIRTKETVQGNGLAAW